MLCIHTSCLPEMPGYAQSKQPNLIVLDVSMIGRVRQRREMEVFFTSLSLQAQGVCEQLLSKSNLHAGQRRQPACCNSQACSQPPWKKHLLLQHSLPELPGDKGCLDVAAVPQEDGAISGANEDAAVDALVCMQLKAMRDMEAMWIMHIMLSKKIQSPLLTNSYRGCVVQHIQVTVLQCNTR
jgi:hypothetical protein